MHSQQTLEFHEKCHEFELITTQGQNACTLIELQKIIVFVLFVLPPFGCTSTQGACHSFKTLFSEAGTKLSFGSCKAFHSYKYMIYP